MAFIMLNYEDIRPRIAHIIDKRLPYMTVITEIKDFKRIYKTACRKCFTTIVKLEVGQSKLFVKTQQTLNRYALFNRVDLF